VDGAKAEAPQECPYITGVGRSTAILFWHLSAKPRVLAFHPGLDWARYGSRASSGRLMRLRNRRIGKVEVGITEYEALPGPQIRCRPGHLDPGRAGS
jgi:hypothetical protein